MSEVSGKFASAHDLRRSFGRRWARRLPAPVDLMRMMRHGDLKTTLDYYVQNDTDSTNAAIWGWANQQNDQQTAVSSGHTSVAG